MAKAPDKVVKTVKLKRFWRIVQGKLLNDLLFQNFSHRNYNKQRKLSMLDLEVISLHINGYDGDSDN